MKWLRKIFGFGPNPLPSDQELMSNPFAENQHWNDELFNLCWEREALYVEIDVAKRQKKKSSHLIAALAKNTARRLEIELEHNGKRA